MPRPHATSAAAIALLAGTLAGCSASSSTPAEEATATPAAVTAINGQTLPGTPTRMVEEVTLVDVTEDGRTTFIRRGVRAPGTRSPIHFHPNGGSTCVEQGEMTLYLEGAEPLTAGPGDCYWMPAGRPMSGYNSGDVDAVFLDIFSMPEGSSYFDAVEEVQPIPDHADDGGS